MTAHTRQFLLPAAGSVALLLGLILASPGRSQSQPARTIKIVVPTAPGGPTDVTARLLAEHIGRVRGLTYVIENRAGAGQTIGADAVARAKPDGNTLLITGNGFLVAPHLRKLNYDPFTSFAPLCNLVRAPSLFVVNQTSPYRTLADLVTDARARPGALTLASTGPASVTHVALEMFNRAADVKLTFVPYPGFAPSVNALLGGHVSSAMVDYSAVEQHLKAGTLRALATGMRARVELLPEVPTVNELGYKGYDIDFWFGLFAPAKTPQPALAEFATWFVAALAAPEIKPKLLAQGLLPVGLCGADFAGYMRKQYDAYGQAIRDSNIEAD